MPGVDIIAHSTGGLIVRSYIQSPAYGGVYDDGGDTLPKVHDFVMLGVPNQGAAKAWNPLNDDWAPDFGYRVFVSKVVNDAYHQVVDLGMAISGPEGTITREKTIPDKANEPDPKLFIRLYVPTIVALMATYKWSMGATTIDLPDELTNKLLLDLNAGPKNVFSDSSNVAAVFDIYGNDKPTPTYIVQHVFTGQVVPMNAWFKQGRMGWYEEIGSDPLNPFYGDGTVPLVSSMVPFVNDPRVKLQPFGGVDHTEMVSDRDVERQIMQDLNEPEADAKISIIGSYYSKIYGGRLLSKVGQYVLNGVEGFLVDALGRMLGWSKATGVLSQIPGSIYFGGDHGIGFILGAPPTALQFRATGLDAWNAQSTGFDGLKVQLAGLGSQYYIDAGAVDGATAGGVEASDVLAAGQQRTLDLPLITTNNPPVIADLSDQLAYPGYVLHFTASATDPDSGETLTFSLGEGSPAGATIDAASGAFTWTPSIADGGHSYRIAIVVTDSGSPALATTQTVVVNVPNLQVSRVTRIFPAAAGALQVALDFNEPLQRSSAENVASYKIVRFGASSLPIESAAYSESGSQHRVLLTVPSGTIVPAEDYHIYVDLGNLFASNGTRGALKTDQLWVDVTEENTLKPITIQNDGSFGVSSPGQFLGYAPPQQVIAGHFTGSGRNDLIMFTNGTTTYDPVSTVWSYEPITLLKNNGDGTFAAPVPIALGGAYVVHRIWPIDWNGDGSPDLLVAATSSPPWLQSGKNYYFVLVNDGHGHFSNAPETPIPLAADNLASVLATGAAVYDLNGNGQREIIHVGALIGGRDSGDYNLEALGKDPYVGYTAQQELPLGLNDGIWKVPAELAFADLNGDGKPDVITRNAGRYTDDPGISVLLSTPTGYATGKEILQPFGAPSAMSVGAFTPAGREDIAVVYDNYRNSKHVYDGDVIQVAANDGHGNFTIQAPLVLDRRDVVNASFADVNQDGNTDLVLILSPGDGVDGNTGHLYNHVSHLSVWTLLGDGHGGFSPSTPDPLAMTCTDQSPPTSMTLADVDGDGFPDVVLGSAQGSEIRIAINDGVGTMRPIAHGLPYVGARHGQAREGRRQQIFADFNNDGLMDVAAESDAGLEVYVAQSDGAFRHTASLPGLQAWQLGDAVSGEPIVGDLNNDGIPDVITASMIAYLGNGDGTFRRGPDFTAPTDYGVSSVRLADVNNDGNLDAILTLTQGSGVGFAVCFGDGTGRLRFNANTVVPVQGMVKAAPAVGDFNGDGRVDMIVGTDAGLVEFLGVGNGTFTRGSLLPGGAGGDEQVLTCDANGDGKLDVVALSGPNANVYLGDGSGGFQTPIRVDFGIVGTNSYQTAGTLAIGDFNGDGKPDLAVSYFNTVDGTSAVRLCIGDGTGHFASPQSVDVGASPFTLVSIPRAPFLDVGTFAVTDHGPVANNLTAAVVGGASVSIAALAGDSDPDNAPLKIVGVSTPAHGVAHFDALGNIIYAPAAGFTGTDAFSYTIADPAGVEATARLTVTTAPAPLLAFISATFNANEKDPSATITITRTGGSTGAISVTVSTSNGSATAGADYTATTQTVSWVDGDTANKTISIPLLDDIATGESAQTVNLSLSAPMGGAIIGSQNTATLIIDEDNDSGGSGPPAPTANPDTFVLGPAGPFSGSGTTSVLANDVSNDGQPRNVTATVTVPPTAGSLTMNPNGSFVYTPAGTFQGIDRFTYQASEGTTAGNTATVTLLSYHAGLVDKLYHQVLHRSAEDGGLVYWTAQLDAGKPLDVVATGIFNSTERLNPLITQFYQQFLGRGTDPSGLAYWVADWQSKGDPRDVVENVLASKEFFDDAGDSKLGYIKLLYQRVLQRLPEQNGLDYWTGLMSPPSNESRTQIASQFYDTHEKHVDLVDFLFGEYFNGVSPLPPTQPYVTDLDAGQTETQVEKAIIDSSDYNANPPKPAAGSVGRSLYPH